MTTRHGKTVATSDISDKPLHRELAQEPPTSESNSRRQLPRTLGHTPPPPTLKDHEKVMATPRTTRAQSRASSVAASVAGSDGVTPRAGRRSARRGGRGQDLSAVGLSSSTAYGTGAANQPHLMTGSNAENDIDRQITLALNGNDHVRDKPRSIGPEPGIVRGMAQLGMGARDSRDTSFGFENSLNQGGDLEQSSIMNQSYRQNSRPPPIPEANEEEEEDDAEVVEEEQHLDDSQLPDLPGFRNSRSYGGSNSPNRQNDDDVHRTIRRIGEYVSEQTMTSRVKWWLKWGPVMFLVYFVISVFYELLRTKDELDVPVRFYGITDITHNFGQFMHGGLLLRALFSSPALLLQHRQLTQMSYEMSHIAHVSEVNSGMLEEVVNLDFLLVVRDEDGAPQLPIEAYVALRERLRNDPDFLLKTANNVTVMQSQPTNDSANIKALLKNERDAREEALKLVTKDWVKHKQDIQTELRKVLTELYDHLTRITVLERNGMSQSEMQQKFNAFMNKAKLEAFANVKINDYARQAERRINYFSPAIGALVKPYDTSATYEFSPVITKGSTKVANTLLTYGFKVWNYAASNQYSAPNSPREALTKWDEYGDCWCSNSGGSYGFGASLGVLVPYPMYPDQIVLEHIARSASIEPGSTPKDIDVFAFFKGRQRDELQVISNERLGVHREAEFDFGFIKIATFTYDSLSEQEVQAFPMQLDLKALNAPVTEIIVRAKNNYGGDSVPYTCFYRVRLHGDRA